VKRVAAGVWQHLPFLVERLIGVVLADRFTRGALRTRTEDRESTRAGSIRPILLRPDRLPQLARAVDAVHRARDADEMWTWFERLLAVAALAACVAAGVALDVASR
jgi:hypothetical protein